MHLIILSRLSKPLIKCFLLKGLNPGSSIKASYTAAIIKDVLQLQKNYSYTTEERHTEL